jgi:hypothetical protein
VGAMTPRRHSGCALHETTNQQRHRALAPGHRVSCNGPKMRHAYGPVHAHICAEVLLYMHACLSSRGIEPPLQDIALSDNVMLFCLYCAVRRAIYMESVRCAEIGCMVAGPRMCISGPLGGVPFHGKQVSQHSPCLYGSWTIMASLRVLCFKRGR